MKRNAQRFDDLFGGTIAGNKIIAARTSMSDGTGQLAVFGDDDAVRSRGAYSVIPLDKRQH